MARAFAQALNCASDGERPCGECRACRLIAEGKHPDVEWVGEAGVCDEPDHRHSPADGARDIRICQVRRIERVVSRTTVDARHRVIVVDPAEAMTAEAANAFLKTLEEPAPNTVLIVITAHEEALRETVRSRCRRIPFSAIARAELEAALRGRWGAPAQQAERLARLAQGRLGWAVRALADERLLVEREHAVDEIEAVVSGGYGKRFSYAASLGSRFQRQPQLVTESLDVWRQWWRDVLLVAGGQEQLAADVERLDTIRRHAAQYGVDGAVRALEAVTDARRHLDEHASATLALETMLLELPPPRGARRR
jgi:DNA polymerase-3 subunit delta'